MLVTISFESLDILSIVNDFLTPSDLGVGIFGSTYFSAPLIDGNKHDALVYDLRNVWISGVVYTSTNL